MTRDEATTILAGLTAAFPTARLEDDTPDVWRKHLMPLDFEVADRAVSQCVDNLKFFPSVADFREFYRLERHNQPIARRQEPEVSSEIPVWVSVWWWHKERTLAERVAANKGRYPRTEADKRPPVQMRDFPQIVGAGKPSPSGSYSQAEYDQLEREWTAAGCLAVGDVSELLEKVGSC